MTTTYLTTEQLSDLIHYEPRTIRTRLKDSVLLEGVHYIRPFGGRKLLFVWEAIQRDMVKFSAGLEPRTSMSGASRTAIPMAGGGVAHG